VVFSKTPFIGTFPMVNFQFDVIPVEIVGVLLLVFLYRLTCKFWQFPIKPNPSTLRLGPVVLPLRLIGSSALYGRSLLQIPNGSSDKPTKGRKTHV
jgi:hypothetical protein